MAFHQNPRVTSLAATAGLVVAYVRHAIQYHRYSWDSILEFFGWWFIHYIAVVLLLGIAYAFTRGNSSFLLGRTETLRKLTLEEAMIFGCIIVVVAAIAIFFAHYVPVGIDD